MTKGIIYLAPGQRPEVIAAIEKRDFRVIVDSKLETDGAFGTPIGKRVEFEFKEVPNDLVSSVRKSARFSRQVISLGSNDGPAIYFLIGYPDWKWRFNKMSGERQFMLMNGHHETGLTYPEFQGRMLTLAMIGVYPCFVPDWASLAETLCGFYDLFQVKEHVSHLIRPAFSGGNIMTGWQKPKEGDKILHIFEGLEGVGRTKGESLWKYFGSFRKFAALADQRYLKDVKDVGAATAQKIIRQMDAEYKEYNK